MVGDAAGRAVVGAGDGDGDGVVALCTVTLATITSGWIRQKYSNRPAVRKTKVNRPLRSRSSSKEPSRAVTVCWVEPSHLHSTVPPTTTVVADGVYSKSMTCTTSELG